MRSRRPGGTEALLRIRTGPQRQTAAPATPSDSETVDNAASDADAAQFADTEADADAMAHADADAASDLDAKTDADTVADADAASDVDSDRTSDTNADTASDANADAETDAYADAGTDDDANGTPDVVAKPKPITNVVAASNRIANVIAAADGVADLVAAPDRIANLITAPDRVADVITAPDRVANLITAPDRVADVIAVPDRVAKLITVPNGIADMVTAPDVVAVDRSTRRSRGNGTLRQTSGGRRLDLVAGVEDDLIPAPELLEKRARTLKIRRADLRDRALSVDRVEQPLLRRIDRQIQIGVGVIAIDEHRGRSRRQPIAHGNRVGEAYRRVIEPGVALEAYARIRRLGILSMRHDAMPHHRSAEELHFRVLGFGRQRGE
jgi:hypothetical protein